MDDNIDATLDFAPGDIVRAGADLHDDGSIPGGTIGALLAASGTRGVIVKMGHVELMPEIAVYVVRFQGEDAVLGPPVGCFADELVRDDRYRPQAA